MGRTALGDTTPHHLALVRSAHEAADNGLHLPEDTGTSLHSVTYDDVEPYVDRAMTRLLDGPSASETEIIHRVTLDDGSRVTFYEADPWVIDTLQRENVVTVDMVHKYDGDRIELDVNIPHREISSVNVTQGPPVTNLSSHIA